MLVTNTPKCVRVNGIVGYGGKKVDLIVLRTNSKNEITCSKPCFNCSRAIRRKYNFINKIYYSNWNGIMEKTTRLTISSDWRSAFNRQKYQYTCKNEP